MATVETIEDMRYIQLLHERMAEEAEIKRTKEISVEKVEFTFAQKIAKHKMLLTGALVTDFITMIFGVLPFIGAFLGMVINFIFFSTAWIYFLLETGDIKQDSAVEGMIGSVAVGNVFDFIFFGMVPTNFIMVLNKLRVIKQYEKVEETI